MKTLIVVCIFFLFVHPSYSQSTEDIVTLKDGNVIHGVIIEELPGVSLKIKSNDGSLFVFKSRQIVNIQRNQSVSDQEDKSADTSSVNNEDSKSADTDAEPTATATEQPPIPTDTPVIIIQKSTPTPLPSQSQEVTPTIKATNSLVVTSGRHKKHPIIKDSSHAGGLFIQLNGGVDIDPYYTGFDGEFKFGYSFSRIFALGVLSGFHSYGWTYNYSAGYVPLILEGTLSVGKKVRPYFLFGGGTAFEVGIPYYGSAPSLLLGEVGAGLRFDVSNSCEYFIQFKLTEIQSTYTFQFGQITDSVSYYPIQTGFNFSL
jgi:hypothetical protein